MKRIDIGSLNEPTESEDEEERRILGDELKKAFDEEIEVQRKLEELKIELLECKKRLIEIDDRRLVIELSETELVEPLEPEDEKEYEKVNGRIEEIEREIKALEGKYEALQSSDVMKNYNANVEKFNKAEDEKTKKKNGGNN